MTINHPDSQVRPRFAQAIQLMLAALAAVVIAVASQGWTAPDPDCDGGTCGAPSHGVGEGS